MFFLIFLAGMIGCEEEKTPETLSIDYASIFYTEQNPIAITIDKVSGNVFVANMRKSVKIQKFDKDGILIKTVVDFTSFPNGNYHRYSLIDIVCDNNQNLYILAKPLVQTNDSWLNLTGFCILQFDHNDNFQKEFDFSHIDLKSCSSVSAIAYSNKFLFVTNGKIIKKISLSGEEIADIELPVEEENRITWPDIHTTDMTISSQGIIYLTGQAALNLSDSTGINDSVGCHITKFNPQTNQRITSYSKGWTINYGAGLNNPGIALSSKGNVYLTTFYCKSLEVYNVNGELINQIDLSTLNDDETGPIDVAVNDSYIYIVDAFNDLIYLFKEN